MAIASSIAALSLTAGVVTPALAAPGDGLLTVEVNRDFSGDGVYEAALDPGQPGIEVTVTDGATTLGPITTDANGNADFDLGTLVGSRFRVDVSIPTTAPDYLEFAPAATNATADAYRSATTFVGGATQTIHVGVWNPNTYVTRNPKVAIAQQVSRGTAGSQRSLMVTDWDNRGPFDMSTTDNTTGIAQVASQAETGTVFGTAWDYRRNGLFSAAYAKSYTVYGPGGSGGIYRTDTAAGGTTGNTVLWATVPNAGTSVHQTIAGRDDAFFLAAGSEGLGGLALSEDGATLYAVNLAEKSLYTFDAAAAPAAPTGSTTIADPGCVGGDWRPFAVTVRDGEVYVGGICDASTSLSRADLAVHILRLDGSAFAPVYTHGLDFIRGSQAYSDPVPNFTDPQVSLHWNPWRDSWDEDLIQAFSRDIPSRTPIYPMPLLTSFAFENDGALVLDFRDRKTDSYPSNGTGPDGVTPTAGHVAGGDLNKVCLTGGVYEWEGEGACPNNATPANSAQPAGRVEFFPGEFMTGQPRYGANVTHSENSLGAVLLSPRENNLIATTMNPTQLYNSSGLGYYDRQAGTGPGNDWESNALMIAGNSTAGNFAKGSGLGGVSLLAAPAPIQIGNYVWFDEDRDGEQGPDEIAVPGATVRLLDADGNVLAETTTDENGEYYFGGEGGYVLVPGAEYIVEFDLTTVDPTQLPGSPSLGELSFTVSQAPDAGEIHDSNPTPTPENPLIGRAPVTAPDHPGGVDHTIDAGIFFGRPSIDIVKFDGRAEAPENPVDGPDAVDGEYGDPTPGNWGPSVDADTEDQAVEYPLSGDSTGPQPVDMIITNTGNLTLTDVSVADLTVSGAEIADLSCDFSPLGGPATGTDWDGPFEPNESFTCTGTLTMGPEELHHDIASVTGQPVDEEGEPVGEEIGDEDPYWAVTPALPPVPGIDIVKFDGRTSAPVNPVDGPDAADGEYGDPTPGDWAPEIDADTEDQAVEYPLSGDSTGPQPVDMIITNTGELALADVTVSDLTVQGSALADVTCDFSPIGGPTTGTSWSGPFQPGDSFTCRGSLTMGPAELHHDIASVTGQPVDENGAPVGETIGDEDPYWAKTPEKPVPGTEEPGVGITKRQAKTGDEADTTRTAITVKAGDRVIVEMPVKNTGEVPLTRVAITDRTDSGPAMTDFQCTFPDGTKVDSIDGEVRWAATFADPATAQWQPGVTFICTGVVTLAAAQTHADTAAVHAVAPDGAKVSDDNSFHVRTPDAPGLSVTGSTMSLVLIPVAMALVALGIVLVLVRRRGSHVSDIES